MKDASILNDVAINRVNAGRGARVEWEHVVPASKLGEDRPCWEQGGRKQCLRDDPEFFTRYSDLHNLVPTVGELNADRSNFYFGENSGESRRYGACDFEVDFKARVAEPPPDRRGDVARIYFHMAKRYGVELDLAFRRLYAQWSVDDPVDGWERERNARIRSIEGFGNCFVDPDC